MTSGTSFGLADGVEFLLSLPVGYRRAAARAHAQLFPWSARVAAMLAAHTALGRSWDRSGAELLEHYRSVRLAPEPAGVAA